MFSALDTTIDQRVAIKVLRAGAVDEQLRTRVRREVNAARVSHPNLVTVFELYEADGRLFLAMELMAGANLRERLAADATLGIEETVQVGRQIAAALSGLHDRGLVHRDVKPRNIMFARDGTAKLGDMGLARSVLSGDTVTESMMVVGTPAFMAPEQTSGAELTPATDVYGLGLTLFQCLTGEVPMLASTTVATAVRRARARPPQPRAGRPDCPRWLGRLVMWMLEPNPTHRPTAEQVAALLESRRVRPRLRPGRLVAAVAAVAVVAAGVLAYRAHEARATARFEVGERSVRGVDRDGERTWSVDLETTIHDTHRADLDGDGIEELVVATLAPYSGDSSLADLPPSEILILHGCHPLHSGIVGTPVGVDCWCPVRAWEVSRAATTPPVLSCSYLSRLLPRRAR